MKLMIVDDHAEIRALIRDLIGGFATEIVECTNGVEAAYRCAAFHPDVVTMDLNLPLLSGFEATRRIVAAEPTARVIVISQFDDAEFRLAASHAGASRFFFQKQPCRTATLCRTTNSRPFREPTFNE